MAYTNWMNNAGLAYFFNKNITIGNAINNDLSTQISLKSSVVNKLQKYRPVYFIKMDDGNPYGDKKVSWTVQKEDETIAKGKGVTDKNGFLDISFINPKNYSFRFRHHGDSVLTMGAERSGNKFIFLKIRWQTK